MPERLEEVALRIAAQRWLAWEDFELTVSIDRPATVGFVAPFEPERPGFREAFAPLAFTPVSVSIEEEVVFNGTLVDITPRRTSDERTVEVAGYSFPAVLVDCTPPANAFPLELNGLKLSRIAETLVASFGLDVVLEGDEGAAFRRVAVKPDQAIFSFLTELAQQRGLVIADTPSGALRFLTSAAPGSPVAALRENQPPLLSVEPRFAPQQYFSEVTAIAKTRAGRTGQSYTVANPFLTNEARPHTFVLGDTDDPDLPTAARAKLGRMLGNALTVTVELPTWRHPGGALWWPNQTILLEAPGAMIYRETEFLIRDVSLRQTAEAQIAKLEVVLPGAFSGEVPESLPWV